MEFTFTKRNKRKLLHEGYAYVMDRTKADNVTIFWRCEKRGECKGRLKTVNDVLEGRPSTTHDCKKSPQEQKRVWKRTESEISIDEIMAT
ncbi:hypothetical protein ACOMHN_056292 [Nucella lapillus]